MVMGKYNKNLKILKRKLIFTSKRIINLKCLLQVGGKEETEKKKKLNRH